MQQKNKLLSSHSLRIALLLVILIISVFRLTNHDTQAHAHPTFSGNMLLVNNREELAVCVKVLSGEDVAVPETLSNDVTSVLKQQLPSHPRWSELGYDQFPIQVDVGCPTTAYLLQPGSAHPLLPGAAKAQIPVPRVEIPSLYRIHLYIVSEEVIKQVFEGADLRNAPQEMICEGHECFEITSALYLTPEEAMNAEILRNRLERILALNLVDVAGE